MFVFSVIQGQRPWLPSWLPHHVLLQHAVDYQSIHRGSGLYCVAVREIPASELR